MKHTDKPVTFGELSQMFIAARQDEIVDMRRIKMSLANVPQIAKTKLAAIDTAFLRKVLAARSSEPNRSGRTPSAGTLRRDMTAIQTVLNWGVKQGLTMAAPFVPKPDPPPAKERFLTPEEIQRINAALHNYPLAFEMATLLFFYTGQRLNAVLGLRWDQIDDAAGIVDFNRGLTMARRRKRRGVLPLTDSIRAVLRAAEPRRGPYVIHKPDSFDRYAESTYRAWWQQMCKDLGIAGATPHTMRHSVATNLVRANVPIDQVSKMLGHSSIAITEKVYAKYSPEFSRNAMDVAARIVGGA